MPQVDYKREDFDECLPKWELVSACDQGQQVVKKAGDRYLPRPNPSDISKENKERFEQYLERAVFYNATKRTLDGLVGQVDAKDPEKDLPAAIEQFEDDIDGAGIKLWQQAKKVLREVLSNGRVFMLVDYPFIDGETLNGDFVKGETRPVVVWYDAACVINWRTDRINGKTRLSLVVIEGKRSEYAEDEPFKPKVFDVWTVLSIEAGRYHVQVFRKKEKKTGKGEDDFELIEEFYPLKGNGTPWDVIPGIFTGSTNNDPEIDDSPIYDIASLNIAHYRNSADYEESCYMVGQPTPWAAGLTQGWVDENFKDGVTIGSRAFIPLPEGGTAGLMQAESNTMPFEAMEHKEKLMVSLGARLVEKREVQRTASEANQDKASENSVLGTVAGNVSDAYEQCLEWFMEFAEVGGLGGAEIKYQLNQDYDAQVFTSELLRELNSTWAIGGLSDPEYRDNLRKMRLEVGEDEDWQGSREDSPQGMGTLNGNNQQPNRNDRHNQPTSN